MLGVVALLGATFAIDRAPALGCPISELGLPTMRSTPRAPAPVAPLPSRPAPLWPILTGDAPASVVRVTYEGMFGGGEAERRAHAYSRRQAWNANETLLDLRGGLVDGHDFETVRTALPVTLERHWSHDDPRTMFAIRSVPEPIEFGRYDVVEDRFRTVHRFDGFAGCSIGEGEGSVSDDDRYAAIVCTDAEGEREILSLDIDERRVLGRMRARETMNWASFTRSGRWVVVENNDPATSEDDEELVVYDPELRRGRILARGRNHGDLGLDRAGRDVFVMIGWRSVTVIDVESGRARALPVADRAHPIGHGHVSCRATARPGWCYVSGDEVLGAVRLDGADCGFELWGRHRSVGEGYAARPKVSVSPSGRLIVFSSDWHGGPVDEFVVHAPEPTRVD